MKLAVVAVIGLLALPTSASAGRMPAPPHVWAHHFANPDCEGDPCSSPETHEVWLPKDVTRFETAHEVGHIWFHTVPTDEQRGWFIRLLNLPVATDGGNVTSDLGWYRDSEISPDELAADAYAACHLRMDPGGRRDRRGVLRSNWITAYGYYPTRRRHERICTAIILVSMAQRNSGQ